MALLMGFKDCSACQTKSVRLTLFAPSTNNQPDYMVHCLSCGKVFFTTNSHQNAVLYYTNYKAPTPANATPIPASSDFPTNPDKKKTDKVIERKPHTPEEIKKVYEINKTKDKCVVCNRSTQERAVFSSLIRYCPCLETGCVTQPIKTNPKVMSIIKEVSGIVIYMMVKLDSFAELQYRLSRYSPAQMDSINPTDLSFIMLPKMQILTERGWVSGDNLKPGDYILDHTPTQEEE